MIRTVTGDIEKIKINSALMHEHIQCVSNDMIHTFGDSWLSETQLEEYAVRILDAVKKRIGLDLFVDGTAVDLGRNVMLMKRISERTGVKIVASTGLYFYPSMLTCKRSAEDLAEYFIYECENGMEGTDILPGILKCAVDIDGVTTDIEKRLSALAITQAKTGLPLYAHCSHTDKLAYEMMSVFEKCNANPERIIIGHASRRLDADYLESVLKYGSYICIDQSWQGEENRIAGVVYELCCRGYEEKILFSHDRSLYNDFECRGAIGFEVPAEKHIERYSFVAERVIPELEKYGLDGSRFICNNALDVLDI